VFSSIHDKISNSRALRPEDSEYEVAKMMPGIGKMVPIPSIWGHWAGGPADSEDDVVWIDQKLEAFLEYER
jgi:hypothetical protein